MTANVFKTRVTNGILGNFSFDRNGDTTAGAVTIYQIAGGKPTVFTVIITPPASLLLIARGPLHTHRVIARVDVERRRGHVLRGV